jgi:hypothetical protein
MKSILLIIPYFGKWPIWFEAHLKSIQTNPSINWLIPTDCDIPQEYPKNIKFMPMSFDEMNTVFNEKLGFEVVLNYRKLCDLKPTYAHVFEDELKDYDFWGFCDMDIIWGNIRKFLTPDILRNYDIISSRKGAVSGHFNLFRNNQENKYVYKEVKNAKSYLQSVDLTRFDENLLTEAIKKNKNKRVLWSKILCNQEKGNDSIQEFYLDRWLFKNGQVINTKIDKEVMYLHFLNWKKYILTSEILYTEPIEQGFYISYNIIKIKKHTFLKIMLNDIKNIFDGFYIMMSKRRLKKKVLNKINNIFSN